MFRIKYFLCLMLLPLFSCTIFDGGNQRLFNYKMSVIDQRLILLDSNKTLLAKQIERIDPDLKKHLYIQSEDVLDYRYGADELWDHMIQVISKHDGLLKYLFHKDFPGKVLTWRLSKKILQTQYLLSDDAKAFQEISLFIDYHMNRIAVFCVFYEIDSKTKEFTIYKYGIKEGTFDTQIMGFRSYSSTQAKNVTIQNYYVSTFLVDNEIYWERDLKNHFKWISSSFKKNYKKREHIFLSKINNEGTMFLFIDLSKKGVALSHKDYSLENFENKIGVDPYLLLNSHDFTKIPNFDIYHLVP
ncbi:MAG: hypothetical protein ACRCTJ_01780 [Brevinema sp.]